MTKTVETLDTLAAEFIAENPDATFTVDFDNDTNYTSEYAEPGYSNPEKSIIFANWNDFPRGFDSFLETKGYAIEWSDEWATCDDCNKAVRTSPDSYGWQPSFVIDEGSVICCDCLKDNVESYLEKLEDNPRQALNIRCIDPSNNGYELVATGFEAGLHPGQTDDPMKIYGELSVKGVKRILFRIEGSGQFDINFSVWTKIVEAEE